MSWAAIIAEGVERNEELEALTELRVPYAQGFLLDVAARWAPTPSRAEWRKRCAVG